jgi:L,D-peptidoglycan transpeptidase YkuD (ErfK/YbiS/YcfS/YnhG family)
LRVARAPANRARGLLRANGAAIPVALGRAGIKANKREGDGATPRGRFRLLLLWWRADRMPRPISALSARPIRNDDAWCEDPSDRRYNRPIKLSQTRAGDRLRRDDGLYDLLVELDHNTRPRVAGRGSAVFVHVARPGLLPTAGCVALEAGPLKRLLGRLKRNAVIEIG